MALSQGEKDRRKTERTDARKAWNARRKLREAALAEALKAHMAVIGPEHAAATAVVEAIDEEGRRIRADYDRRVAELAAERDAAVAEVRARRDAARAAQMEVWGRKMAADGVVEAEIATRFPDLVGDAAHSPVIWSARRERAGA